MKPPNRFVPNVADLINPSNGTDAIRGLAEMKRKQNNPAGWMFARLMAEIKAFEDRLNPDEESGGRLIAGAGGAPFHIKEIDFSDPDLLIFKGTEDGRPIQLIQHHSQLSIQLVALPAVNEQPRRIGFLAQ